MYWYYARNDPKSQAGNYAIIESISKGPVKTITKDNLKPNMFLDSRKIFDLAYIVDVEVETIDDMPKLYKIVNLHDIYEK